MMPREMTVPFRHHARLSTLLQPYLIGKEIDWENSYSVLHHLRKALFQKKKTYGLHSNKSFL